MIVHTYFIKFFVFGQILLASGLLIYYALPPLITLYIDTQIALTPNSQSYPLWKDIPVPVYQKFYFFNVTNAQDVEQRGHKPLLEEIGPFTYKSDWTKKSIENDDIKNIINFKQFKTWKFEPELSIADHKLQLVTLNAPLAITLTLIQSASNAVRLLVTFSLDGLSEGFFTKRSVEQLLFDGYPDLLTTVGPLLNAEMLSQGGHFGYMNARNNSQDGLYEINTGFDDITKLNTINRFNGKTKLTYWNHHNGNDHCNSLEGATTGEMFPPPISTNAGNEGENFIKLFQPDFCRVWRLNYESKFEQQSTGLNLQRFVATRDIFRNSTDLPENSCFFNNNNNRHHHQAQQQSNRIQDQQTTSSSSNNLRGQNRNSRQNNNNNINSNQNRANQVDNNGGNSNNRHHNRVRHEWPAGVFTLAPCKFNAPIYISMPHFLDADPYFLSKVNGLTPDRDKHEFYIDLEPRTGSPVTLSARVQLNVAISKPPGLVRFRNVPEIMFPVFWQELSVNITGAVIDQLLLASQTEEATILISYIFFFLGGIVLITTGIFYLHDRLVVSI